jgi:hypothetical protein
MSRCSSIHEGPNPSQATGVTAFVSHPPCHFDRADERSQFWPPPWHAMELCAAKLARPASAWRGPWPALDGVLDCPLGPAISLHFLSMHIQ